MVHVVAQFSMCNYMDHGAWANGNLRAAKKPRLPMAVQLVLGDLSIEGIAVESKDYRGLGLISTRLGQGRLNESLFELTQGLTKIDLPFDHFRDKGFQLLFHKL